MSRTRTRVLGVPLESPESPGECFTKAINSTTAFFYMSTYWLLKSTYIHFFFSYSFGACLSRLSFIAGVREGQVVSAWSAWFVAVLVEQSSGKVRVRAPSKLEITMSRKNVFFFTQDGERWKPW